MRVVAVILAMLIFKSLHVDVLSAEALVTYLLIWLT